MCDPELLIDAEQCIYLFAMTQSDEELESLKKEENTLEKLRTMVAPEHWPRIYTMLRRIRERMQKLERADSSKQNAA